LAEAGDRAASAGRSRVRAERRELDLHRETLPMFEKRLEVTDERLADALAVTDHRLAEALALTDHRLAEALAARADETLHRMVRDTLRTVDAVQGALYDLEAGPFGGEEGVDDRGYRELVRYPRE